MGFDASKAAGDSTLSGSVGIKVDWDPVRDRMNPIVQDVVRRTCLCSRVQ